MLQDYREMTVAQLEQLEKQTLFTIVHAIQQYSAEAKVIFDTTPVPEASEVIVLAEDIVQRAGSSRSLSNRYSICRLHRL